MLDTLSRFKLKTQVVFGRKSLSAVGELAKELDGSRCLVVADPAMEHYRFLEAAVESLAGAGLETRTFEKIEPEPFLDNADDAAELGRRMNADVVVGMGGGSALDTAKAAAALIANGGNAGDYLGLGLVPKPSVPTVMIPTTAGTGAEVTFTAVFTNRETRAKGGINSPHLFPDRALLDPELTLSVPPDVTAATGMDALTHAIESVTGRACTVFTEAAAYTAIRLIAENLRRAVFHGEDLDARENMLLGSLLAGVALADAGVGAAHALAYPLGGNYRIPHGLANAVLIPHVMAFNLPAAEDKFARIAQSMGIPTTGMSMRESAEAAVVEVSTLAADIGIPTSLDSLDVPLEDVPMLVEGALKVARPIMNNPRPVSDKDAELVYLMAFGD